MTLKELDVLRVASSKTIEWCREVEAEHNVEGENAGHTSPVAQCMYCNDARAFRNLAQGYADQAVRIWIKQGSKED